MDTNNAIEIQNLSKTFKVEERIENKKRLNGRYKTKYVDNKVLNGISFNIRKGEVVGILGRNGSGKSTLLSIISKIMEPDSGTIKINGKIASILELGMGFHPDMSGRENIYTKGELYGFSKKEMDQKVEDIIDYSGIRRYIDNPVRTYSSGMSGRLAFAIMINVDSDILLVDEVLSVGDASFSIKASQHFKKMSKTGKTILLVSHSINMLEEICNRAIWIESGQIVGDGPVKTICAEYQNKINESPEIITDLAESGESDAQYKLAIMYKEGRHYPKDLELYKKWIILSAMQGNERAQIEYGDILLSSGNKKEAINQYLSAAERGNRIARVKVASLSFERNDLVQLLLTVYDETTEKGNGLEEYRYGELLLNTSWNDKDREKSFELFKQSAEDGYVNAIHQIGIMYRDGVGTSRDYEKME